ALTIVFFRHCIVKPLMSLSTAAETVTAGDLSYRIDSQCKDEFGVVSNAFDHLVGHLERRITAEERQKMRQKLLTEAVISLSRQTAKADILEHVGELAMEMVQARYAMITYTDSKGKRQLIPLGMSEEQIEKIVKEPKGEGLLGLFWEHNKAIRIKDIASHPESIGFPEGHPPMHSLLGVPIVFAGEPLGAIYLSDRVVDGSCPDGQFSQDDEDAITVLASACAIALSNLRNAQSELAIVNRRLHSREIELELMNEELTHANEAKSQFLANTSHELRTPLNAIIGFSELLKNPKMGALSDKQKRYVDHVHVSGKRLLTIINDLLDISKIEAGMMMIDEIPCLPGQIAHEVAYELMPLADSKHITLSLENMCVDDEKVLTDAGKLHQIMVNLIGNAIKFTPDEGRVDVHVSLKKEGLNKQSIVVIISDTGCGIADEDQEKIFEPFVQASGGLNREHGGTGLGLALTRRQINLLGGTIQLHSELGQGSRFTVTLPVERLLEVENKLVDSNIEPLPVQSTDHEVTEVVPSSGPRPKILVIDADNQRSLAIIALMEGQSYEAYRADIVNVAELCESLCPYLIMLGIPSEDEQLHQNLQALKADKATRSLPVILVGGVADDLEFSTGPVGVVEKGNKQQEVLDMISRYCNFTHPRPELPSVLVVDDEPTVREFLRETLVAEGFRVLLARDGREGVQIAVDREPDMIILDLMMPQVSGFDVIRQLNRHPIAAQIPIIIYTAKDLTRDEVLQLGQEAERILIKGSSGREDLIRQLQRMELLYPARAQLIDQTLDCFNTRYMDRRLDQEIANAKRHTLKFSLVCWQVDGYNDYIKRHGERWGTVALKEILEIVKVVTRRGDICARVNEAEFLLFLPGIEPANSERVAEKLRIRIRQKGFQLPSEQAGKLTASFAAVHFGEDAIDVQDLKQLLAERLSEAIHAGGDQGCYGGDV
ncbi:MAG: ATP-binding protein, partial [Mariprofundaceae bacterium]|nr:ATP-binding protein [Mariprofundaceae bacterium]